MSSTSGKLNIEGLLRHADWVEELAHRLVRDASRADDVVQEVWVRAMTRPPTHAANPRGWLATAVRSVASNLLRSEGRRGARESIAARPEAGGSVQEIYERTLRKHELVAAVLALDEPYRDVLLLRYFENLPPRSIAIRLELPVATVKTRLQRGLDRLRGALDREYGSSRDWVLALCPLALAGRAARRSSLVASAGVAACAALLGGLTLIGALRLASSPEVAAASSAEEASRAGALEPTLALDSAGEPGTAARVALDPAAAAERDEWTACGQPRPTGVELGWRGRILGPEGEGVAGALIEAIDCDGLGVLVASGPDGRFELAWPGAAWGCAHGRLEVRRPEEAEVDSGLLVFDTPPSAPYARFEARFERREPLAVELVDERGRALGAGFEVELGDRDEVQRLFVEEYGRWFARGRTGPDGRLTLRVPREARALRVRVEPSDTHAGRSYWAARPGPGLALRVELPTPAARSVLEFVDARDDHPLLQARARSLSAWGEGAPVRVRAARVELEDCAGACDLLVECDGYGPLVVRSLGVGPVRVRLWPTGHTELHVVGLEARSEADWSRWPAFDERDPEWGGSIIASARRAAGPGPLRPEMRPRVHWLSALPVVHAGDATRRDVRLRERGEVLLHDWMDLDAVGVARLPFGEPLATPGSTLSLTPAIEPDPAARAGDGEGPSGTPGAAGERSEAVGGSGWFDPPPDTLPSYVRLALELPPRRAGERSRWIEFGEEYPGMLPPSPWGWSLDGPTRPLTFVARDPLGRPMPGVYFGVSYQGADRIPSAPLASGTMVEGVTIRTGPDGVARGRVPVGLPLAPFAFDSLSEYDGPPIAAGDEAERWELVVERALVPIRGRILGADGRPDRATALAVGTVVLEPLDGSDAIRFDVGADGVFGEEGVPPGTWRFWRLGFEPREWRVELGAPDAAFEFVAPPLRELRLRLVDGRGEEPRFDGLARVELEYSAAVPEAVTPSDRTREFAPGELMLCRGLLATPTRVRVEVPGREPIEHALEWPLDARWHELELLVPPSAEAR